MSKVLQFSISVYNREPEAPTLVNSAKTSFTGAIELLRGFGFSDGDIDKAIAQAVGDTRMASCNSETRHCQVMKINA